MYPHSFLWHYLWIAPYALQLLIAAIMVRRRLVSEFPVFFAYTVFEAIQGGILFTLDHLDSISGLQYWQVYWVSLLLTIVLRFALIREIFSHVFSAYPALGNLLRLLLGGALIILLLAAIVASAYIEPSSHYRQLVIGVHILNRAVSLIQTGLLVFLFLFASYFRLSWRSYVYGIAVGLGIFSSVDLATSAIRASIGPSVGNYQFDFVTMATYHCCVLVWLVYMLAPEPLHRTVKELPSDNLDRWNDELERLLLR
jgi:hypothetical protein